MGVPKNGWLIMEQKHEKDHYHINMNDLGVPRHVRKPPFFDQHLPTTMIPDSQMQIILP